MGKKPKAKGKKKDGSETLEKSFAAALKAVESSPDNEDAWNHAEDLADQMQRPEDVAALYRQVLGQVSGAQKIELVARRAVQFHEEWFGDDPDAMSGLFIQVMEVDPDAEWAFDRLVVELTSAKKWDDLLSVYDRTLASTQEPDKRKRLLNDAMQVAKDFANEPGRAADYLKQLLVIEPDNKRLMTSLERLLERQDRWQELIDLWRERIPTLPAKEVREMRVRIATCYLEKVGDAAAALEALRALLSIRPGFEEGLALLERILEMEDADHEIRLNALALLRTNYDAIEKPEDAVRVLEIAISFSEGEKTVALHREAGDRLAEMGEDSRAMEHFSAVLRLQPTNAPARKNIRRLAERSSRQDLRAQVLAEAAEACAEEAAKVPLLMEAAKVHRAELEQPENAIDLYKMVLANQEADPAVALSAAQILNDLLAETGRSSERLAVLDQLANLEQATSMKRHVLGQAAKLAQELGEVDRALAAWNARLEADPGDIEALGATIILFEGTEQWTQLVEALQKRAGLDVLPEQRRVDLVRAAQTLADKLDDATAAIDAWTAILEEFGERPDAIEALDVLLSGAARWSELAAILEKTSVKEHGRAGALLARLGEVHGRHLDQPREASRYFGLALGDDPSSEIARGGMKDLLDAPDCALEAALALTRAYEATDDWEALLALVEPHLAATTDTEGQVKILRRAAQLQEQKAENPSAALGSISRAFCIEPTDLALEAEFERLAKAAGEWQTAATTYRAAADALEGIPARAAQLRLEEGRILDEELNDPAAAVEAYAASFALDSAHIEINRNIARAAARAGQWDTSAAAVVSLAEGLDYVDGVLLEDLEKAAEEGEAWDQLAVSLGTSVANRSDSLRQEIRSELELKIAVWHRDHGQDLAVAESAAQQAVAHGASHPEGLRLLAELQRRVPGKDLVETLLRMDDLAKSDLDALYEATEVAIESSGDRDLARTTLQKLYQRATTMWRGSRDAEGERSVEDAAAWAHRKLVASHIEDGDRRRAAQLLIDGAKLPFDRARRREMKLEAATMLSEIGEGRRAIELYQEILEETPDDLETIKLAAALCERADRLADLLALKMKELALTEEVEHKLELRMEISRLTGEFEERGGRVESLLANLRDMPGHEPSIASLTEILGSRGQPDRLADIFTEQARKLEEMDDPERAAKLWVRAARLAEKSLRDVQRAIEAYSRVVDLSCTNEALDALARLHIGRDEPAEAIPWLERRLESASEKERVAVRLQLARACLRAERDDKAIASLETAFEEAPRNAEVRRLLIERYRERENWKPLAAALVTAAGIAKGEEAVIAYAREAYEIYEEHLGSPGEAVEVLEKAAGLDPDDRDLKRMLADALLAKGRHDEAREIIQELIEGFGRRRSPERAGMHLRLARVAHALDEMDLALDELETASKMDHGNVSIMSELAELARESGNHERAEAAYQSLLMTVRRRPEDEPETDQIGPAEVLLELSRIAADQGQDEQSEERIESAIEAIAENDAEAMRIQNNLRRHEEYDLLKRVLETRLEHVKNPRKKGRILSELADLLEGPLEQPEEALEMRLGVIENDPVSPLHHDAARELAVQLGQTDRYVKMLEKSLKKARRDTDTYVRCELLLRLGEVMEKDKEDLKKASKFYKQAEETGVREIDVWRAAERVQGALGNQEEQMRLLGKLASMGEDQVETRASALYSMAEVMLAHEDTLAEGLSTLRKALEDDARYERAGLIMGRGGEKHAGSDEFMDLYGQVARNSGDEQMLLDYLVLKSGRDEATPEDAHEAADLALKFEEWDRAEALMLRAVEIGHGMPEDLGRIEWALLALAERRMEAGDLAGAVKWLSEAKEVGEPDHVFALGRRVAELAAGPEGDLTLVAKLYESLLERYPTARGAWEPLAVIYGQLQDVERLQELVDQTLDSLHEVSERNALRLTQARALLEIEDQIESGVESLRNILMEDPEHEEAQELLIGHFESQGRTEDLIELLQANLMAAQGRRDITAITTMSLRLGQILENVNHDEAVTVYRSSLEWAPKDPDLLRALLESLGADHDPPERAELMERRLASLEGSDASSLALELTGLYESMENDAGAMRALELGYRGDPANEEILRSLQSKYEERGNHTGLARLIEDAAASQEDPTEKVPLLLRAASVYRDSLGDAAAALKLLDQASELAPDDVRISIQLAASMVAAGELEEAVVKLTGLLESVEGEPRLEVLRMRAAIHMQTSSDADALADLEEAFTIDTSVAPELEDALERRRMSTRGEGDVEAERTTTFRLIELQSALDKRTEARENLHGWIESNPQDIEALHLLRDIDTEDGYFEGVAATCAYLAQIEEGDAQIEAVLAMSRAYSELGRPEDARQGLEKVHEENPDNDDIRAELRSIYEQAGINVELARLLVEDAMAVDGTDEGADLLRRAGELLTEAGKVDEAIPIFQDILEMRPGDAATAGALVDAYIAGGNVEEANSILDASIEALGSKRSPELAALIYRKSRVAEAAEDIEQQLKWLHEAFKMDRHNGLVAAELANLAEMIEDWDLALQALRAIALIKTGCPISLCQSLVRQGRISLRTGDEKRALFFARKAKKEDPEDPDVIELLSMMGET